MQYRFYLLGFDNRIKAGESFAASSDGEALQTAIDAYSLAEDDFGGFELWRYATLLSSMRGPNTHRLPGTEMWAELRQLRTIELEEMLERSFDCMRSSRALMKKLDGLRLPPVTTLQSANEFVPSDIEYY